MGPADIQIPPALQASLKATGSDRVLLIRHADRPDIPAGDSGHEVGLTNIGVERATRLGEQLGNTPRWAVVSPLRRCRLTAQYAGFEYETSNILGAPGPFVEDRVLGGEVFRRHGTEGVVHAQIRGETWGCMRPLGLGSEAVLRMLSGQLAARRGTGLAVTHDAIVMPIIAWVTGEDFSGGWLSPLDGAVVTREGFYWKGQRFDLEVEPC